ncbi:MAG TPA: glyceraldehyde 3-phosphate dehydrogenase NAD-binding domain-containing protein, partial [Hanamia sp.]|nr:glyceraldehyde 3-phosphate dehydrogenase NAD-binding domain-containing protein [Hanamia sp.]
MKIGINGFGRIGRASLKVIMDTPELEVVAINDLMTLENAAYLLKYDSVYGIYDKEVSEQGDILNVGDKKIKYLSIKDPAALPWKDLQ